MSLTGKRRTLIDPITGEALIPNTTPEAAGAMPKVTGTKGQVLVMGEDNWEPKTMVDDSVVEAFGAATLNEALAKLSSAVVYNPTVGIKYHIGESWETINCILSVSMQGLFVHENVFMYNEGQSFYVSFDGGNNYTQMYYPSLSLGKPFRCFVYFQNKYIGISTDRNVIEITKNGVSYIGQFDAGEANGEPYAIVSNNKLYVALLNTSGAWARIYCTEDLVTWTNLNLSKPNSSARIAQFCATNNGNLAVFWTDTSSYGYLYLYNESGTFIKSVKVDSTGSYYALAYNNDTDEILLAPYGNKASNANIVIVNASTLTITTNTTKPSGYPLYSSDVYYIDGYYYLSYEGVYRITADGSSCKKVYSEDTSIHVFDNTTNSMYALRTSDAKLVKSVRVPQPGIADMQGNLLPINQLDGSVKIATGSYTGTGTYASSGANSLTFDFVPKVVFVSDGTMTVTNGPVAGFIYIYQQPGRGNNSPTFTLSDTTLSWIANNASQQANTTGAIYYYIAIG